MTELASVPDPVLAPDVTRNLAAGPAPGLSRVPTPRRAPEVEHLPGARPARLVLLQPIDPAPVRRAVKDVWERLFAALLLVLTLPLLVLLALAIRADRGGPAVFRQVRVGRNGTEFVLLKLRTMRPDAEEVLADLAGCSDTNGVLFKMREDPRVTRLGRLLRRYSLDELPQLWNVVRGDMALVGPRPALPDEVAAYPAGVHRRLTVKPGLTGLWQVSGRSDLSWEESQRIDLRYVDQWSLRLDLLITLRTVRAVVGHQGAY
ncbi:sugar transferase [Nocardioides campestrisoli]|uniref:sugar transferase n=1 Tax=Nocardioides campestrisoli TaxID=2736757 RepID=UPI00163D8C8E|nr:sugar transferase [Nocardioides campestrisoli]